MRLNNSYIFLSAIAIVCTCLLVYQLTDGIMNEFLSSSANTNAMQSKHRQHPNDEESNIFPRIIHHTWKRSVTPPSELVRWRKLCLKLNPDFAFRMYNDEDLLTFTKLQFKRYLPMLQHLRGVYMADMARVLIAYHFGGIYMDLDFYCHKPFKCLLNRVLQPLLFNITNGNITMPKDILVVAREPLAHAVLFRNKSRVVIQDFYLATPKHPFLLWLLEDRYKLFQESVHPLSQESSTDTAAHTNRRAFPKGPFSYSIEKDIDRYYAYKYSTKHTNGALRTDTDIIVELDEDILHPLVDATNSRLFTSCAIHSDTKLGSTPSKKGTSSGPVAIIPGKLSPQIGTSADSGVVDTSTQFGASGIRDPTLDELKSKVCRDISRRKYFQPSADTVLVHMWTHVYLGWSFVRGLYNAMTYWQVESSLPPTTTC